MGSHMEKSELTPTSHGSHHAANKGWPFLRSNATLAMTETL
jgi:hypothetical protein